MMAISGVHGYRSVRWVLALAPLFVTSTFADDASLPLRVRIGLAQAGLPSRGEIDVEVADGAVTLRGFTVTLEERRRAEEAARKQTDVVENRIQVVPEPRSDAELSKAAEDAVRERAHYAVFDNVEVGVTDGVVTLEGSVLRPSRRTELEVRVARLEGVRAIQNEIRVQPVSVSDQRLRVELYRRIYGHDLFQRYAGWAEPPVRIVVEHGSVTLTGVVGSQVEKAVLESVARGTPAVRLDNQVRIESEVREEPARIALGS
jgi:hyperosmotically inducible periplasmic protein